MQYQLLRRWLAPPGAQPVVVGDDDQSIYRWRGAEWTTSSASRSNYPGAQVVKLEQNYRSTRHPRRGARGDRAEPPADGEEALDRERPRGEPLRCLIAGTSGARRRRSSGGSTGWCARVIPYSQMAVFYRANAQSRVLEEALRLARVPYTLVSGRGFYERAEVKDAAAYLRLMVNPRSDARPPAGDQHAAARDRRHHGGAASRGERSHAQGSLLREALAAADGIPALKYGRAQAGCEPFRQLVERLRERIGSEPRPASSA